MPLVPCHMLSATLPGVNKGVIYVTHGEDSLNQQPSVFEIRK